LFGISEENSYLCSESKRLGHMKFPIGIQTFEKVIQRGCVYVDKTDLVYSLVKDGEVYFLSRPRRFGKSLLISTLESYFLGKKDLFKGLKIEALEKDWKTYPVLHVDFGAGKFSDINALKEALDGQLAEWEEEYHVANKYTDFGLRMKYLVQEIHKQTGMRVVVLVDEYDKPLLDVMDTPCHVDYQGMKLSLEEYNRETLKSFYSSFKAADEHLQFVFLTGVTKFSQVSVFSGFNQPEDISLSPEYETLCGITEEEMLSTFAEPIEKMSKFYRCNYDEMVAKLKKQYDGYHFSDLLTDIYNPFSLLNAFKRQRLENYWFQTGAPTYLIRLMEHFGENLDELTGKYYAVQDFSDYKADVERPLPMIYQSGYLTIKDYDYRTKTFKLDIPNDEVKQGFISLLANNYFKASTSTESWIVSSISQLDNGALEQFRQSLTSFLASIPYSMRRKENERERERYFHYTFYLILRLLSTYMVYTEKQLSQGRADCIIEAEKFVYIFEFKLDGTADEALQQIEDRGYALPYANDPRTLYKIGCSFSSETGTIEEWKTVKCIAQS
jgi:hypothetical protein